jgi:hypothetical protein
VDEVVNIMQDNIDKVMQRGERLDDLRGKTGMQKISKLFSLRKKRTGASRVTEVGKEALETQQGETLSPSTTASSAFSISTVF